MITKTDVKMMARLLGLCQPSDGKYCIVASVFYRDGIYSIGHNSYIKTHPLTLQVNGFTRPIHAEISAISKFKHKDLLKNSTLYIAGTTKKGNLARCTKPCSGCQSLIKKSQIVRVVYQVVRDKYSLVEIN